MHLAFANSYCHVETMAYMSYSMITAICCFLCITHWSDHISTFTVKFSRSILILHKAIYDKHLFILQSVSLPTKNNALHLMG